MGNGVTRSHKSQTAKNETNDDAKLSEKRMKCVEEFVGNVYVLRHRTSKCCQESS
jgi:hypothetical protein